MHYGRQERSSIILTATIGIAHTVQTQVSMTIPKRYRADSQWAWIDSLQFLHGAEPVSIRIQLNHYQL
jgi:hypothetical protein